MPTDAQELNFGGTSPGGVIPPDMQRAGYDFHMARSADDFFLVGRGRDGRRTSLTELIHNMGWSENLEDVVTSGSLTLSNALDSRGRRISQFIGKGSGLILLVRNPVTGRIEEKDRFVVWERERTSDGMLNIQFYDYMKYLSDSKITVLYTKGTRQRHWNAGEITRALCRDYGIRLARLPRRSLKEIPYFYQEEQSILDILIRLWTMEAKESKRRFVLKMVRGRLHVITKAKRPRSKVLELSNDTNDSGILGSMAATDSLEGVATVVRLWGTAKEFADGTPDTRRAVVKSKQYASRKGVATWGRLYFEKPVEGIITQADIDKQAKKVLKSKTKSKFTVRAEIIGFPYIRAGAAVRVRETISGVNGLFWFKNLDHVISGDGEYKASGDLTKYEYTKTLATDPSDLKPDRIESDGATGDLSVGDLSKDSSLPNDVWLTLRAAAPKAGVPGSWANSDALEKLLGGESSHSWTAQNPESTAYGLFQFLDSTWDDWDTGIRKEQAMPGYEVNGKALFKVEGIGWVRYWKYNMCVAGLRYIKRRYGTPEKAYAFWLAKSPHWY